MRRRSVNIHVELLCLRVVEINHWCHSFSEVIELTVEANLKYAINNGQNFVY